MTEVSWSAYNLKESKVTQEETVVFSGEVKLSDAVKKFTDFVFQEIIMQNYAFKIIVEGDWVMKVQFTQEAQKMGIRLGPHFSQYSNIFELVADLYADYAKFASPLEILERLGLSPKSNPSQSMERC
jgi:hypothetical protein